MDYEWMNELGCLTSSVVTCWDKIRTSAHAVPWKHCWLRILYICWKDTYDKWKSLNNKLWKYTLLHSSIVQLLFTNYYHGWKCSRFKISSPLFFFLKWIITSNARPAPTTSAAMMPRTMPTITVLLLLLLSLLTTVPTAWTSPFTETYSSGRDYGSR